VVDAVASADTPSFSPTRQKLSGAGETLRGRSPLYAINGIPQSTPLRDGSPRRLHDRCRSSSTGSS
jgi:iron complex outermembrane receptor protein